MTTPCDRRTALRALGGLAALWLPKAASQWVPGFFDRLGWGLGMAVVTGPDDSAAPGSHGWDGGLGTVWRTDPRAEVVTILLTQRAWSRPEPPLVCRDFWPAARAS